MSDRRQESFEVRARAAELARSREHPVHKANVIALLRKILI